MAPPQLGASFSRARREVAPQEPKLNSSNKTRNKDK